MKSPFYLLSNSMVFSMNFAMNFLNKCYLTYVKNANVIPINLKQKFKKGSFYCPFFLLLIIYLLKILSTKNNPKATAGPIPKANNKVPIPTVPPKYHPTATTDISRIALTKAIGKFDIS